MKTLIGSIILVTMLMGREISCAASVPNHTHQAILSAATRRLDQDLHKKVRFTLLELDVQGMWAYALAHPRSANLDDVHVLLRERRGLWRVVDFGGDVSGKGVPGRLRKRWKLLRE